MFDGRTLSRANLEPWPDGSKRSGGSTLGGVRMGIESGVDSIKVDPAIDSIFGDPLIGKDSISGGFRHVEDTIKEGGWFDFDAIGVEVWNKLDEIEDARIRGEVGIAT
jgi:hypothetical protein